MKTELYYFSGTGNSLFISKEIAAKLGNNVKIIHIASMNLTKEVTSTANKIGIIFPVYFLDAPKIVKQFITKLRVSTNTYFFAIDNCGAKNGVTPETVERLLGKKGIELAAYFSLHMPDNSIVFPTPVEKWAEMIQKAEGDVKEIVEQVKLNKKVSYHIEPYIFTPIRGGVEFVCKNILGFKDMKLNKARCNGCGICNKVCPINNIVKLGREPQWKSKNDCTMCFACIHFCPNKAITYRMQNENNDYQYVNPKIGLTEIIEYKINNR
jgi:ferredoxin